MSNTDLLSQAMSVNNLESSKGRTEDNDADSDCDDKLSGSESPPVCGSLAEPRFDVPEILEPGSGAGDECYQAAAETIISHCREKAKVMGNEISAPYEVPHFPIELQESRKVMQQQLSTRQRVPARVRQFGGAPLSTCPRSSSRAPALATSATRRRPRRSSRTAARRPR
ncbi:uncharacterized protein LOC144179909 [Haemaphysalis longicornis]